MKALFGEPKDAVQHGELIPEVEKLGADFAGVESPELPKQIQIATGGTRISLGLDAVAVQRQRLWRACSLPGLISPSMRG